MAHLCLCAAEALEAWKKVENSIVSFTAVGISIDSEAATEASAACATAQALIVSLFPAGKNLLSIVLMQSLIFRHGIGGANHSRSPLWAASVTRSWRAFEDLG